jgi:hypothetical protein
MLVAVYVSANNDHQCSAVTGSVNTNVGATSVTSASQCQCVTVSVNNNTSIVSVSGERQCQYNQCVGERQCDFASGQYTETAHPYE